jgi:hypothetical protein
VSQAAELSAEPSTLATVFARARAGDTVRLAAGDYGTFRGGAKAGTVTLSPLRGAQASIRPRLDGATHIAFDGLTIDGADVLGSSSISFRNSRFTGMTRVDASVANAQIVFDRNTFDGIDACATCYEGRLTVRGHGSSVPVGVRISNNRFGGGGESDGVQIVGDAYGTRIGPGNEFTGLRQLAGYTAHVDPIQLYGDSHTVIDRNYFHGNSTGIMAADGTDHAQITDNVFHTDGEYPDQIVIGGGDSDVIRHNTFANGARARIGRVNVSPSVAETVTDNVLTGGIWLSEGQSTAGFTINYNLNPGGRGSQDIRRKPVFRGGTRPASFSGFALAAGTPGKGAASDRTDMGIRAEPSAIGGSGAAPRAADGPPDVRLLRPNPGRLPRVLSLRVRAEDDVGVARVVFRVDEHRIGTRSRMPYAARHRVAPRLRRGSHTVSARAVDSSGKVASVAAAIAGGRVHRERVMSVPGASGGTKLRATGLRTRKLVVQLARCRGGSHTRRVTLSRARSHARVRAGALCIVSLFRR